MGGALFGPIWGTFYNLTGATLGAAFAFLVTRDLASGWARARAGKRIEGLLLGMETQGWRFVSLKRLVPLFPFNRLNYVPGLTRITFPQYLVASYVFMLPSPTPYLGFAGREVAAGNEDLIQKGLITPRTTGSGSFPARPGGPLVSASRVRGGGTQISPRFR